MNAHYRLIHFIPDPFLDGRVPIAALVEQRDGRVSVVRLPHTPGPQCLGGQAASSLVQIMLEDLGSATRFDRLPFSLGPHAVLGKRYDVPSDVANPEQWIATQLCSKSKSDRSLEYRGPHRATRGYRFFELYDVHTYVKRNFRPGEDASGFLASATVLKSISHYVEGNRDLLLMEPIIPGKAAWRDDVIGIATTFGAYKTAIRHERIVRKPRLTAYVLAGGTTSDVESVRRELAPFADDVVDTSNRDMRASFLERIRAIGSSGKPPDLFNN